MPPYPSPPSYGWPSSYIPTIEFINYGVYLDLNALEHFRSGANDLSNVKTM